MTPDAIVQNYLTEADRLYRSCRPSPESWSACMQHLKNADILLYMENTGQAIAELDKSLQALRPLPERQGGLFNAA